MRCEAQTLCQRLDQYSVRHVKEGLGRGHYTIPIHKGCQTDHCCRLECHANDPIALLKQQTILVVRWEKTKIQHSHIYS